MKRLLLCGSVAVSLVVFGLVAYRDNEETGRSDEKSYNRQRNRRHRGVIRGTVDGATDIARGTGHAIGHGLKNVFGGGNHHRGFYDSEGNYHE